MKKTEARFIGPLQIVNNQNDRAYRRDEGNELIDAVQEVRGVTFRRPFFRQSFGAKVRGEALGKFEKQWHFFAHDLLELHSFLFG